MFQQLSTDLKRGCHGVDTYVYSLDGLMHWLSNGGIISPFMDKDIRKRITGLRTIDRSNTSRHWLVVRAPLYLSEKWTAIFLAILFSAKLTDVEMSDIKLVAALGGTLYLASMTCRS